MSERTRVLFFLPSLGGGGAELHALRVANHLDRARFEVSVAVSRAGGAFTPQLSPETPLHVLGTHVLAAVRPLRRLLAARRPDVVCSFMERANCTALAATLGLANAPAVVACVQTVPSIALRQGGPSNRVLRLLVPWLYPRASHVVALSTGVRDDVVALVPAVGGRITVVPNAGFDEWVLARARAEPSGPPRRLPGPSIVGCGRLTAAKSFDVLLRAFALVRRRLDAQLWLVGEGELRGDLEREAVRLGVRDAVWFAGFQENPYALLRSADVFALSSSWEGFGNVLVEAMAVGTPVVSTDCPHGPREIVEAGRSGLLVRPGDETALADGLISVLGDAGLAGHLVAGGRVRAQAFEARVIAERYGALLLTLKGLQP